MLLGCQHLLQFTGLIHLAHDVGAADEFTIHIQLRYGRPVGKLFNALTNFFVFQHIDRKRELIKDIWQLC